MQNFLLKKLVPLAQAEGLATKSLNTVKPNNLPTDSNFFVLLGKILNFSFQIVGVVVLGAILYAGFLLLTAGGDEEKLSLARKIIAYSVAGVVILALSFALVKWLLADASSPFKANS